MTSMEIVFGSGGFIGSHYSTYLKASKSRARFVPDTKSFLRFVEDPHSLAIEPGSNIIWLSGKVNPTSSLTAQKSYFEWDLWSLRTALNILSQIHWYGKFILLSSGGCIYKNSAFPLRETDSLLPNNSYGEIKLSQERIVKDSVSQFRILRVSNVFGASSVLNRNQNVIGNWILNYKQKRVCKVYGDLASYRDYINVKDVVTAILRAGEKIGSDGIFNVGSSTNTLLLEIVEMFRELTGNKVLFEFENRRRSDSLGYVLNIDKAKSVLGWQPEFSKRDDLLNFLRIELEKN